MDEKIIVIIATLDTKGSETLFVKQQIEARGPQTLVVDVGILGEPSFPPDIFREEVARAGGQALANMVDEADTATSVQTMSVGATAVVERLYADRRLDGVLSIGGGKGTAIGTTAMRALPLGVPKVAISTGASGNTRRYVGTKDIVMHPAITDIIGLNRVNRQVLVQAAGAIVGMVEAPRLPVPQVPAVGITALGITTPAAMACMELLEVAKYEIMVFHATGVGGCAMEELAEAGMMDAILDLTTVELVAEATAAGLGRPDKNRRLITANAIPRLVCPGGLDMIAFGPRESISAEYAHRILYQHTPVLTVMRTTAEEMMQVGKLMGQRLNAAQGPVAVLIPAGGFSAYDREGDVFCDPQADQAFVRALQATLRPNVPCRTVDAHINDPAFASSAVDTLLDLIDATKEGRNGQDLDQKGDQ